VIRGRWILQARSLWLFYDAFNTHMNAYRLFWILQERLLCSQKEACMCSYVTTYSSCNDSWFPYRYRPNASVSWWYWNQSSKYQFCCLCIIFFQSYQAKITNNFDGTSYSASMYRYQYLYLWIHLLAVLGTWSIGKIWNQCSPTN